MDLILALILLKVKVNIYVYLFNRINPYTLYTNGIGNCPKQGVVRNIYERVLK